MTDRIRRKDWFDAVVSAKQRIGNDFLLLPKEDYWVAENEPFLVDCTTAIFLTKGDAAFSVNMVEYKVEAPAIVIFMEGMIIKQGNLAPDSDMNVILLSKEFTGNLLAESNVYGLMRSRTQKCPVFPLYGKRKVMFAFYYLLVELVAMEDSPYRLESAKHMALTLFYGFALNTPDVQTEVSHTRSGTIAERFLDLVREYYREQRSVSFYADRLCITPKYLSLSVKEATGKPALEWIDDYVCAEAKALLRSTEMSIDRIGESLNFMSQSLFGKYFKRVTGMSPRQYRYSSR